MICGQNYVPPKYIRAIKINNISGQELTANVTYEHAGDKTVALPINVETTLEEYVTQGQAQLVDPVQKLSITRAGNNQLCFKDIVPL